LVHPTTSPVFSYSFFVRLLVYFLPSIFSDEALLLIVTTDLVVAVVAATVSYGNLTTVAKTAAAESITAMRKPEPVIARRRVTPVRRQAAVVLTGYKVSKTV
jgi:hypothetical protein